MKVSAMWLGAPGSSDLVHHTAKHFLSPWERHEWDRVPAGSVSPESAAAGVPRIGGRAPPTGEADMRWWSEPWLAFIRAAHRDGYLPRYRFLVGMLGAPGGARWECRSGQRWVGDLYGFRVVVRAKPDELQVISAYFSSAFRQGDAPGNALRAFREYASRVNCPPAPPPGVSGAWTKP